jgi:aminoglycoside phosphotransferase (APT) family kinase protein
VPGTGHEALTSAPGWYTRDEFVGHYAEKTGRDLSALRWHEVLGVFKLAVILQQIYYRYWKGQTQDERFSKFDERVKALTALAVEMVEIAG